MAEVAEGLVAMGMIATIDDPAFIYVWDEAEAIDDAPGDNMMTRQR